MLGVYVFMCSYVHLLNKARLVCTRCLFYTDAYFALTRLRYCYEDDCPKEDPLSQENFRKLALPLPYSKQHHSKLVCYITKELMDTENPPQVLPNGYVYSTKVWK